MSSAAVASGPSRGLIRAMPWVFVLIWSTGFVVARFGMPHAPPLTFLSLVLRIVTQAGGAIDVKSTPPCLRTR